MAAVRTSDGFEFETTREDRVVRCVCRRGGREASVEFDCGWDWDPEDIPTEQIELFARNAWLAQDGLGRRDRAASD